MHSNYPKSYISWKLINFHKSDLFGEKTSDFLCNICMRGTSHPAKGLSKIKAWHELFYGKKFKISKFYLKNLFICVKVWFYEIILKTKSLIVCSIISIFDKLIRDDANWRKRQFNTVDLFFNLYELEVLNTYRMLLGQCIELRCIV